MAQTVPYPPAKISGAQADELQARMIVCAERMTNDQILNLADALHAVLRARKKGQSNGGCVEVRV